MINQLRIYEVPPGNAGPFLERFRDHAARLMGTHGFRIQAMWTDTADGRVRFVYLLCWRDADVRLTRGAAFMADEYWAQIMMDTAARHGDFVLGIEDMVLTPTDFSAAIGDIA